MKASFSSIRSGKNHRNILRGAAATVDLGLDEKQTLESRSSEALSPKLLVVFGSPPRLTDDINFFLLTSLSCCSYNTDISAEGAILHLWRFFGLPSTFTAHVCTSRLAEGNQLQEAAVCAGSSSIAPALPCLLQLMLLSPLPTVPSLQKGNEKISSLGKESIWAINTTSPPQ